MKTTLPLGLLRRIGSAALLLIALMYSSCGTKPDGDPFVAANFNPYDQELGERIEAYHQTIYPDVKSGTPAIYIDFSSGINKAFVDLSIKNMMVDCFNTVLAEKFEAYKLGSNAITPMNVANTTELGQQVSDLKQYADIWAPIQKAVEKIVSANNDALLITDFEEWQQNREVTTAAYLKIPFSKWLSKGNSIHFFMVDYSEGKVNKHLYFTIFNTGNPTAASMLTKLQSKLAPLTTRFDLTNKSYQLRTAYASEKSGGIFYDPAGKSDQAKNVLDLKSSYINGLKNGAHFEFYPLGVDWENIAQLQATYSAQNQFNDFFRNLFADLSNEDSYIIDDFEVKVADVTADFEKFAKAEEAKKHKPKVVKGSNGEDKLAEGQEDLIASTCYQPDGKLKDEWAYTPQAVTPINEVFTFNKTLYTNTKKTDPKNMEFAVAFDPTFNIKQIQNPDGLIRVDLILPKATPNLSGAKMAKFQWLNAKQTPNVALYESIKNTLEELRPNGQVVYSYYIKTKQ